MRPAATDTFYASTFLPQICRYVPNGLEKAILFYNAGENNSLVASYTDTTIVSQTIDLPTNKITSTIRKLRQQRQPWEWFAIHELDFDQDLYKPGGNNLFTPLHESVLLLRLPTSTPGIMDLLFLYFNGKTSYLCSSDEKDSKPLLKQTKEAIGAILSGMLTQMYVDEDQKSQEYSYLMQMVKNTASEFNDLSTRFTKTIADHQERIFNYCVDRLTFHAQETGRTITVHTSAKKKLLGYDGEITFLDNILKNAILYADYTSGDSESKIIIEGYHIQFSHETLEAKTQRAIPTQRTEEARSYLDRMERAAAKIQQTKPNTKLTGTALGENMNPEVSASAISQWIAKYGSQMVELLMTYDSDWMIIRNSFQPLRRKLTDALEAIQKTGS